MCLSPLAEKEIVFLSSSILSLVMIGGPVGGDGSFYRIGWVLTLHLSTGNFVKIFNSSDSVKNIQAPGSQQELSFTE